MVGKKEMKSSDGWRGNGWDRRKVIMGLKSSKVFLRKLGNLCERIVGARRS